jgi:hypothetical protein
MPKKSKVVSTLSIQTRILDIIYIIPSVTLTIHGEVSLIATFLNVSRRCAIAKIL